MKNREVFFSWWLGVIALLLPSYLVRMQIGIPTTLLEINIYLCFAMFVFLYRKELGLKWKELVNKVSGGWIIPIVLFFLSAIISVAISPEKREALGLFKAYFIDPFLFLILLVLLVKKSEDYKRIIGGLGLGVAVLGLVALLQRIGLVESAAPWINESPSRVISLSEYPNALGLYVGPITVLYACLILFGEKLTKREKVFSLIVVILGCLAGVLAVSRGAVIGILGAMFLAGVLSRYRIWAVVFGVLLAAGVFLLPAANVKLESIINRKDVSTDTRIIVWENTTQMIKDNWLFGVGLSGFPKVFDEKYRPTSYTEPVLYPHNIVMNFWVEIGLLGLLSFIWLQLVYFSKVIKGREKGLDWALGFAMVALLIHGLVDVPYFKNDLAVLFWILIGLMITNNQKTSALKKS